MLWEVSKENIFCFLNLSQQYEAEFGRLTGKRPGADGLYSITLPDETHRAYLACDKNGHPLGFAVIDTGREVFDVAEFYVIPALRRQQIGQRMAARLFDSYPGSWQVRQIAGADGAYRFWVSVIAAYTEGAYSDTVEVDPEWGQVRIQRFNSKGK